MVLIIWVAAAAILTLIILSVPYVQQFLFGKKHKERINDPVIEGMQPRMIGGARRVRNMRHRAEARARLRAEDDDGQNGEEDDDVAEDELKLPGKVGTKKLRKIQMKAEKKAMREQEEALREDHKKREALREEERKKKEEEERKKEEKQRVEEQKRREEQEKREEEEYLALKESFVVEDEGEIGEEDSERSFQEFINYIKQNKVVFLETLAAEFGLRTRDAISRVQSLQQSGNLTGVVDDRGKFIYISREELEAVAKFIKQRGRVSIAELVTSSNTLINLQPEPVTVAI